ncbi:hypothetical protein FN846DRAFT_946297 [Sphaerosporella brunnea]|uniref:Uncharacterized protein n=1 Tax=Sphaerosporella brunnea TaxID=1250544 RepID=A0A5J5EYX0_9PEZI|nr:hypothetical protein FN846DRAFT_946297 [Sphaerosporella brunnea]
MLFVNYLVYSFLCTAVASARMVASTEVPLKGCFYWKLVFDYDNSDNAGTITQTYRHRTIERFSQSTFSERATEATRKESGSVKVGSEYRVVSASVEYGFEGSWQVNDMLSTTTRSQTDLNREIVSEFEREYRIGPHSKLSLYQLYFDGPGITYGCDVYRTTKEPREEVMIHVRMKEIEFVSGITVVYGNSQFEKPDDSVKEIHGGNADINAGYGGSYVYLVPTWTTTSENACTGFDVIIQPNSNPDYPDLARGAGGDWRYLRPIKDRHNFNKVVEIGLIRKPRGAGPAGLGDVSVKGFNAVSGDLNKDRGGDWLHVAFKTVPTHDL